LAHKPGTDKEILGKSSKFTEPTKHKSGRPKVNRDLVIRNLKQTDSTGNRRYTNSQISKMAQCSPRTINRIMKEAVKSGEITEEDMKKKAIGTVEADFDSECFRVKGYSFLGWLETKFSNKSTAKYYFNFCSKVWDEWKKPSLIEVADSHSQMGDQLGMRFVLDYGDDKDRMRPRLKKIRYLFRYLGRGDVNDSHLTMSDAKHPRAIRDVPEITQSNFPALFSECIEEMVCRLGNSVRLDIMLKLVSQMRTGSAKGEREFYGIKKGSDESKTYLTMVSPEEYRFKVFAKRSEKWDIFWMPEIVRNLLWERYEKMNIGDNLASIPLAKFRTTWGDVTEEIVGRRLVLHDLRKISLTWLYVMGVPSEVAIKINVGWLDMNTALAHYLNVKKVLRKTFRAEYREQIPEWFKDGLDEYTGFEAVI